MASPPAAVNAEVSAVWSEAVARTARRPSLAISAESFLPLRAAANAAAPFLRSRNAANSGVGSAPAGACQNIGGPARRRISHRWPPAPSSP